MTTQTFREGDVVRWPGCRGEYRVTSIDEYVRVDGLPGAEHTAGGGVPSVFVLTRRPLRMGDVLRLKGTSETQKVTDYVIRHARAWLREGWTHEDGTPIDVEAPAVEVEAKAPDVEWRCFDRADVDYTPNHHTAPYRDGAVDHGAMVRPGQRVGLLITGARPVEAKPDHSSFDSPWTVIVTSNNECVPNAASASEDVARVPMTRLELSDACGELAHANRELLVENAQLRREVERLTRKVKR